MKILDILNEDFNMDDSDVRTFTAPKMSLSDLNSLQLRTLERLRDGVVDMESASEKELDIILDLIDMGLVDADGNVTVSGEEASDEPDTNVTLGAEDDLNLDGLELDDFDDEGDDSEDITFNLRARDNPEY